jgi:hypothetical protein
VEWREAESTEQPPRERRETRGRANELGLGLGARSGGALGRYIGREGGRDPTVTGRGGRDPTAIVPGVVPAVETGRARVGLACWEFSPTRARGSGRAWPEHGAGQAVSFSGRVLSGRVLSGRVRAGPLG